MKLSNRDKALLLGLAGFLIAVASYVLIFNPFTLKSEEVKLKLETLKAREAELVELQNNMEHYKTEIIRLNGEKEELVARFPAEIKPESEIMYAVELENRENIKFSALDYGQPTVVSGNVDSELAAYCLPMNMTYQCTYQAMKNTINYTLGHSNRMVIDAVTMTFDKTTGNLTGNMTLNMFYITGTERTYEEPYVPTMKMGVNNIFGTAENPVNGD